MDMAELGVMGVRQNSHGEHDLAGKIDYSVEIKILYITVSSADIPVAIYTPSVTSKKRLAALVYFHGGGWISGNISQYHAQLTNLAKQTNSLIISVNYQKAPEHKFPIPFNDCYEALEWVMDHANLLNIDRCRIGVGGDSAGGNLAAAVALAARDRNLSKLAYQLLIYPCNGPEFVETPDIPNAKNYGLTQKNMKWMWEMYLNNEEDKKNAYAVPHAATSYRNLPPAIIITAEYDVLRRDGITYYEKLKLAGNNVVHTDCLGVIHGFFSYGKYIDEAIAIRVWIADHIVKIVGK